MNTSFAFPALVVLFVLTATIPGGCVAHRIYNEDPSEYIQSLQVDGVAEANCDLAIIEFDDQGIFWKLDQMEDAIELIRRRNRESPRGVLVITFVHGWQNNADPNLPEGDLSRFRDRLVEIARGLDGSDVTKIDHVIGIYLGWRGATSRVPVQKLLTFWDRSRAAERVASLNMRETLLRVMSATSEKQESKCYVVGHSLGGMIVGKTLAPTLTTLLLANGRDGVRMPADLVLLQNPALDALASWQFIEFLKRSNATAKLISAGSEPLDAPGPIMVSITSDVDSATGSTYQFGRTVSSLFTTFRNDQGDSRPNQRFLARRAEGHVEYLISHRAWVEDGEIVIQRVPGAFNDTPFWIIQVTKDISKDHKDVHNPVFAKLVEHLSQLNRLFEADVHTKMFID